MRLQSEFSSYFLLLEAIFFCGMPNSFIYYLFVSSNSGYDPAAYRDLPVSSEIRELFKYIERYNPQTIQLDFKLKPFIPDYIPSIGDIDAFIKVPRPDGKPDNLGFMVVDEPSSNQSDPHVLDLYFRTLSKQSTEIKQPSVRTTYF